MNQPVLFLSHGAPMLADDPTWTAQLREWGASLGIPKDILIVSAHWENSPVALSSTTGAPLLRDFWGFPEKYYHVPYDAPAAPELLDSVVETLGSRPLIQDPERGLDHGAYVPLVEMFPKANVPVLQLSLPTLDPAQLLALGHELAPLREQGTLIIASGFTTHNLRWFNPRGGADVPPPPESARFDAWAQESVQSGDMDALLGVATAAPDFRTAHPRSEHLAPLYVALGASGMAEGTASAESIIDGFWFGLSKRSWQFS